MELKFLITREQLITIAERIDSARIANHARLAKRMHAFIVRALLLWIPLLSPLLLFYFFAESHTPETYIAIAICAIAYLIVWQLVLKNIAENQANKFAGKITTLDRTIENTTLQSLASLEGCHTVTATASTLTFVPPSGKSITIPWKKFCAFKQDDDFYYLTICNLMMFKATYLIAKNGDTTETAGYQAGLEYITSRLQPDKMGR
ncbi:hypothetical protein KO533_03115 [Shewanella sp. NKUCC05_KAH]|uniref:hypothetical protein n=1 Tax=Shewanella sp. NKUCC05_KAH TaxID=2842126 RepID=UPI001C5AA4B0|nr:hypothetical protein [Shewanella sp. NKUCC05_KAH]MBW3525563.1 hypothetical protein [Shewanella sp. NKUCC05_KAH]